MPYGGLYSPPGGRDSAMIDKPVFGQVRKAMHPPIPLSWSFRSFWGPIRWCSSFVTPNKLDGSPAPCRPSNTSRTQHEEQTVPKVDSLPGHRNDTATMWDLVAHRRRHRLS